MTTGNDERAARLKAALRDNLRRRKAQARGRAEEPVPAASGTKSERAPDPPRDREG